MPQVRNIIVGVLASPLVAAQARAEDETLASIGVQFTVAFGERVMVGLGLDLRVTATVDQDNCFQQSRASGAGVFGQATWLMGHGGRFSVGAHAGKELEPGQSLDAELAWTYRMMDQRDTSGHGIHLGLLASPFPLDFSARTYWTPGVGVFEGELGFGGHLPPVFGYDGDVCVAGRPLWREGRQQLGTVVAVGPARRNGTPVAAGLSWLEAARAEAASVPAFMALGRDLDALGAPALARRARRAARDEVRHTRACRRLASPALGVALRVVAPAAPNDRISKLTRLAIESWRDGCIAEGTAARRAELALARTTDPATKATLAGIARDEAEHAELAWDVLAYALARGGGEVHDALHAEVATTTATFSPDAESRGAEQVDPSLWARLGRLDRDQIVAATEQVIDRAMVRVRRL